MNMSSLYGNLTFNRDQNKVWPCSRKAAALISLSL